MGSAVNLSMRSTLPIAMARAIMEKAGGVEKVRGVRVALQRMERAGHGAYLQMVSEKDEASSTLVAWAILGMTLAEVAEAAR